MMNRGDAEPPGPCWPTPRQREDFEAQLRKLGYHYAGGVPVLTEGARQRWVVALYARGVLRARSLLRGVPLVSETAAQPDRSTPVLKAALPERE